MNWRKNAWKIATAIIVVFIIFNPETVELALFIDAIGLDMFFLLIEVQLIAIFSVFFNNRIKPTLDHINFLRAHFAGLSWRGIRQEPESLLWVIPSQATIMFMLVFSCAISIAII